MVLPPELVGLTNAASPDAIGTGSPPIPVSWWALGCFVMGLVAFVVGSVGLVAFVMGLVGTTTQVSAA